MSKIKVVVVVDGMSSGRYLAPAFLACGFPTIHVHNVLETSPTLMKGFDSSQYIDNLSYTGDIKTLLDRLREYQVLHVLPGTESGVLLADTIANHIGTSTANPPELSSVWRDKYLMQKRLADAGIPHARSLISKGAEEIVLWVARDKIKFPIIIKPVSSAGTDGVTLCTNSDEVHKSTNKLLGSKNMFGATNDFVVAQEYLRGTEYYINSVSAKGIHRILEIWKIGKVLNFGAPIYDYSDIIAPDETVFQTISGYIKQVLDNFGMLYGSTHTEIMLTERGPILIESAARMQGNINPALMLQVYGSNQMISTARAFLIPEKFLEETVEQKPLMNLCKGLTLILKHSGKLNSELPWDLLEALPSSFSTRRRAVIGEYLQPTVDLYSAPGGMFLMHPNREVLEEDYAEVRRLEQTTFYENVW